jgi:hypothetical protein
MFKVKEFITFFIIWVSQNLSIPFWVVGHVHLTMNVYHDIVEYGSSLLMNLIVGLGFYLDWKEHNREK